MKREEKNFLRNAVKDHRKYCRECKRKGTEPLTFKEWLEEFHNGETRIS